MKNILTAVYTCSFPTFIDISSYIGGQVLMLTTSRYLIPGKKKCREIWRRANIVDISVDETSPHYLVVEIEQVSILHGGAGYIADPKSPTTLHIRADSLAKTKHYSMLIETLEEDMKMVYCFCETGCGKTLPDETG